MAHEQQDPEHDPEQETAAAVAVLRRGVPPGLDHLVPAVYTELRRLAHRQLAAEPDGHTLSTTALVHEAYLRLADQTSTASSSRAQFLALAARAMRRVLIDHARRHRAARRGGVGRRPVSFEDAAAGDPGALAATVRSDELLALDDALDRLATMDPRLAAVVECRFFGGLTEAETAEALGVSKRTVSNDWLMAKGWLYRELRPESA